jgi:hypothetical protein
LWLDLAAFGAVSAMLGAIIAARAMTLRPVKQFVPWNYDRGLAKPQRIKDRARYAYFEDGEWRAINVDD